MKQTVVYLQPRSLTESPNATEYQVPVGLSSEFNLAVACTPETFVPKEIATCARMLFIQPTPVEKTAFQFRSVRALLCFVKMLEKVYDGQVKPVLCTNSDFWSLLYGLIHKTRGGDKWVILCWDHPFISDLDRAGLSGRFLRILKRCFFRACFSRADRLLLLIHPHLLDELRIQISAARKSVHPNGVDVERLSLQDVPHDSDQPLVGVCSSVSKGKGLEVLISAFLSVQKKLPTARLLIIGEINPDFYSQLAGDLTLNLLGGAVDFTGLLPISAVMARLSQCWVCVYPYPAIPKFKFNFALKLGEYLALGKPVVAVDTPGSREYIEHMSNGLLVESGVVSEMANALHQVLTNRTFRENLSRSAKLSSARHLWVDVHKSIAASIRQII